MIAKSNPKIVSFELEFENCNSIKFKYVPGETRIFLGEISETLFDSYDGQLFRNQVARNAEFILPISYSDRKTYFPGVSFLTQLLYRDITGVTIVDETGMDRYYQVPWKDADDYVINEWQENIFGENEITITIKYGGGQETV